MRRCGGISRCWVAVFPRDSCAKSKKLESQRARSPETLFHLEHQADAERGRASAGVRVHGHPRAEEVTSTDAPNEVKPARVAAIGHGRGPRQSAGHDVVA